MDELHELLLRDFLSVVGIVFLCFRVVVNIRNLDSKDV